MDMGFLSTVVMAFMAFVVALILLCILHRQKTGLNELAKGKRQLIFNRLQDEYRREERKLLEQSDPDKS